MNKSEITLHLAEKIAEDSMFPRFESKSGSPLLFNENYISSLFAERFQITENLPEFEKAFQIVTNGVGNEAAKINSVISSSLLSLLVFHKLFENESDAIYLRLNLNDRDYTFTQALFEVRNKVINFPSCVDVVLKAEDGTLLFLESKFTEYIDGRRETETYGAGYCPLYESIGTIFEGADLKVDTGGHSLKISSEKGKQYIEGIKQSVSHLIGLVRGPQHVTDGPYNEAYFKYYQELYENAPRLIYGTILFDPSHILPEASAAFKEYKTLYENIIGAHGSAIVSAIEDKFGSAKSPIEVLPTPLTYQDLLLTNPAYKSHLPERILKFYQLS